MHRPDGDAPLDLRGHFMHRMFTDEERAKAKFVQEAALHLATLICEATQDSRERSLALTNLEQVTFWTNAAIARHGGRAT